MQKANASREKEEQRKLMIEFIVRIIQQIDDKKLRNIYNFVLHIQ